MTEPQPALQVAGVHASLGGASILRGVDFDVGCGEVVGLLGRNGAGKTTLLRVVTGVLSAERRTTVVTQLLHSFNAQP